MRKLPKVRDEGEIMEEDAGREPWEMWYSLELCYER